MAQPSNQPWMLILDDDAISRELLALLLQSEGYRVEVAQSGDDGLVLLNAWTGPEPVAVLADLQMPGTAGKVLGRRLRAACSGETVLLAMSGSKPLGDVLEEYDGFLLKPFSVEELKALVAERQSVKLEADRDHVHASPGAASEEGLALNEEIYSKLVDVMPGAQLHSLYMLCVEDGRKRAQRMSQLALSGDEAGFVREAHALKGGCGMLGATELYDLASDMESEGLQWGRGGLLVEQVGVAFERLERILVSRA